MTLRAIGFDLWETLITDTPEQTRQQEALRLSRIEDILRNEGFDAAAERIDGAYRSVWGRLHALYWATDRDIPCRRQVEHFLEELDLDPKSFAEATLDAMETAYARAALEVLPEAVSHARETLDELTRRDLRIGLISNTGRTPGSVLREILAALGIAGSLHAMVFSNEHGECKPQRSIFEELRRGLGVDFKDAAFVGDNLYVDVHGAQRVGMRGILFAPDQRGTAVAPAVDHGLTITPDATIRSLAELPAVVDRLP